jgi:hypothetical protein
MTKNSIQRVLLFASLTSFAVAHGNAGAAAPAPAWPILETAAQPRCAWQTREPAARIFASEAEWRTVFPARQAAVFARTPDWKQQRVIALTLGARPTPGYAIELDADQFELRQDNLWLSFHERAPAAGEMLLQVMTQPCVFILVGHGKWQGVVLRNSQTGTDLRAAADRSLVKTNRKLRR